MDIAVGSGIIGPNTQDKTQDIVYKMAPKAAAAKAAATTLFKIPKSFAFPLIKFGSMDQKTLISVGLVALGVVIILLVIFTKNSVYMPSTASGAKGKTGILLFFERNQYLLSSL